VPLSRGKGKDDRRGKARLSKAEQKKARLAGYQKLRQELAGGDEPEPEGPPEPAVVAAMEEQAGALDLHLDLAEELAQLAESVGNMPDSTFHVVHAAPTPSRDNLVVDIVFSCDAPVEPADQDRMRRGHHTRLRFNLFDITVEAGTYDLAVYYLGSRVRSVVMDDVLNGLNASIEEQIGPELDPWFQLIRKRGLCDAVLDVLVVLLDENVVLPCSGIAVDKRLEEWLTKREASMWEDGWFHGVDHESVRARVSHFPADTLFRATAAVEFDGAHTRCVRTTECFGLVRSNHSEPTMENLVWTPRRCGSGVKCGACEYWEERSLRRTLLHDSKATAQETAKINSKFPLKRLPKDVLLARARNLRSALDTAKQRLCVELAKVDVDDVVRSVSEFLRFCVSMFVSTLTSIKTADIRSRGR
jgi:hypothetical protein